jgi:tetratricopeptide (TPR) repeat protein
MQSLYIELKSDSVFAQLRYRLPGKLEYETKSLQLSEIEDLYGFADRDFETRIPDLGAIGKRLFLWLDGDGRWLSRVTESSRGVVLAIDASKQLAGLPWETMQDGNGFLVNRCIVPVRVVGGFRGTNPHPAASQYRLQMLFMATCPEDVAPKLDFEEEEWQVLAATQDLPIELRVEESGCLSELTNLWRRFPEDYFHIFHLTGHASILDHLPYFITESPTGDRVDATVEDFDRVFQLRYPRLMFLSGCRTGQSINGGAVPSLAASLVEKGATAVLGWARPVSDTGATQAATELYRSLAQGLTIAEALGLTYQALIQDGVKDWCLLRLYARVEAWGALVLPPGDMVIQPRKEAKFQFLDRQERVRVAGADEFVGRRRYLQQGLRALKSSQNSGIWLYGIGGVGKSTIACRLLDRLGASYHPVVCYRDFDETVLRNLLSRECESISGHEILNGSLLLPQKLSLFLKQGLNAPQQRYLFVLDDFEANLEDRGNGLWGLKALVVKPLKALLEGIDRSQLPHRVIITSRYDVKVPEFDRRLARLQVDRLDRSDVAKKYQRLKAFQTGSTVDRDLQIQAKSIADGYPRLLEWLDKVLQDDLTDSAAILAAMAGKQQEFLENILAAQLLAQQEPDLRSILMRGLIFELPVPLVALQAICEDVEGFDRHVERARSVGLLEVGLNGAVRVPRVLGLGVAENGAELAAIGVKVLNHELIETAKSATNEQLMELHRLALLAGDGEIAVDMAKRLSNYWILTSRYREALTLCKNTLALQRDPRIIYNLAKIYSIIGDWTQSLELAEQTLSISRQIGDSKGEAAALHQIAIIYTHQGKLSEAFKYCQDSLAIYCQIGDDGGEAAALHQMAIIYSSQGKLSEAFKCCQDSLTIYHQMVDSQGESASPRKKAEAAALHQMAMIYTNQEKWQKALQSCKDSRTIDLEIGNKQGEAASFNEMGYIVGKQGDTAQREEFYIAAAQVYAEIGDYSGLVAMLCNLGVTAETQSLTYLAQALWITLRLTTNLGATITLIEEIYQRIPTGDPMEALLGAVALYFCKDSPHPEQAHIQERSFGLLAHTAKHQEITTQDQFDEWIVQNQLNDPNYYLPALNALLVEIIGGNWLFDPQQVSEL